MKGRTHSGSAGEPVLSPGEARIAVDAGRVIGDISPFLTGVNMSYYYDTDEAWGDGRIAQQLREVRCSVLRFPGGEETSFHHWEIPGAPIYRDAWDTDPKSRHYADPAAFVTNSMDTGKFLTWCEKIGAEPLVGVNIESGARLNRIEDSAEEARRWVAHCKERGHRVRYWYMDNESYLNEPTEGSGNYKQLSVEQYAEYVTVLSIAMRELDPSLKVIVNWDGNLGTPRVQDQLTKLLKAAGQHIDIVDFHYYWNHGKASWELWLDRNPMRNEAWDSEGWYEGIAYADEITRFRRTLGRLGYDIKLAALEWNIGPSPADHSMFQHALMQSEMLAQFMEGGLHMACIWPLTHPVGDRHFRSLLFQKTWDPAPLYHVFKLYSRALGQRVVKTETSLPRVRPLAAISRDGRTLLVYLLHKSREGQTAEARLEISGFQSASAQAVALTAADPAADEGEVVDLEVTCRPSAGPVECTLPPHSLTMITLSTPK